MLLDRRQFVCVAACICLCVSTAHAGGNGGTKKDATIRFRNDTTAQIGVAVNPSAFLLASTNPTEFAARGGKILNPGDSYKVAVRSGVNRAIAVNAAGAAIGDVNITVGKGKVAELFVTAGGIFIAP